MIGSLRGRLLDRGADGEVLIEVAGVGYRVHVAPDTLAGLATAGEVFLYIHHVQREDAQILYGFPSIDARRVFEALLGAQGVGPAVALAVLSEFDPMRLRLAVAQGDVDALKRVKGVGAKTAARMVIDLKSRLQLPEGDLAALVADPEAVPVAGGLADVRGALAGLGYSNDEIRLVIADLPSEGDTSSLLKAALVRLGARR
jgi:Holliday junction DNA helicase RuvA